MREAKIIRKTAETDINLTLNLDGQGKNSINSGIGFMDHMLTLFAVHSGFDLFLE
ncbi:MAG: imidazoleglycerol-phosphate dehydratase, partial [Parasporobacterium sp.]|nr:imidazoleglycerol-phosphate dehydratase [Parasporobacterium sp.]